MFTCDICDADANKACTRCAGRIYCSETCQRADWIEHRQTCVEVEGAFDRLRRRTQFASILPEYFVHLHQLAVVLPGGQTLPIQRHTKAVNKAINRLRAGRTVVKGETRREAYRTAFLELKEFSEFVPKFVVGDEKTLDYSKYFKSLQFGDGDEKMIFPVDFETLLDDVSQGNPVPPKDIKNPSKEWGKNLDAYYKLK